MQIVLTYLIFGALALFFPALGQTLFLAILIFSLVLFATLLTSLFFLPRIHATTTAHFHSLIISLTLLCYWTFLVVAFSSLSGWWSSGQPQWHITLSVAAIALCLIIPTYLAIRRSR